MPKRLPLVCHWLNPITCLRLTCKGGWEKIKALALSNLQCGRWVLLPRKKGLGITAAEKGHLSERVLVGRENVDGPCTEPGTELFPDKCWKLSLLIMQQHTLLEARIDFIRYSIPKQAGSHLLQEPDSPCSGPYLCHIWEASIFLEASPDLIRPYLISWYLGGEEFCVFCSHKHF